MQPTDYTGELLGRATYSPEDNKLRIYPDGLRLDAALGDEGYAAFKAAGYKWAAKQECFVAPRWTPTAEDWALALCGEIDDEDYSPEERSADRAERFDGYREKRTDEAGGYADRFDAGPAACGHQNRQRAERQARRLDGYRKNAVSQWGKAEYWQRRTAGVIAHALHRSSAHVRRGRILTLEAEQRKYEKGRAEYAIRYKAWQGVLLLDGADSPIVPADEGLGVSASSTPAARRAYHLANIGHGLREFAHPRTGRRASLYSLLTDPVDPITAREAATLWLDGSPDPADESTAWARWGKHYELRLTYERAMLDAEGGTAAAADMEPGGWILADAVCRFERLATVDGWAQVIRVNRSPKTKRVTSVVCMGRRPFNYCDPVEQQKLREIVVNIERAPEDAYRPPTDEERQQFATATKARKAAEKATKPKAPPLVNPTNADAERLQAALNAIGEAKHNAKYPREWERRHNVYEPTAVCRMTQAEYSRLSAGDHSPCETRTVHGGGGILARRASNMYSDSGAAYDQRLGPAVCKVRIRSVGNGWYSPPAVVVLTDKPQAPLPLDWEAIEAGSSTEAGAA